MKRYVKLQESFQWVKPTKTQLDNEWKTENIISWFLTGYLKKGEEEPYKKVFMDNLYKFSKIETIKNVDKLAQYKTTDIDKLKKNISHMHKDVDSLVNQLKSGKGKLPYPLLKRNEKGILDVIGGRTRITVATMFNMPVKAIVIDHKKMQTFFYGLRRERFLKFGFDILAFLDIEKRQEILNFLLGNKKDISPEGHFWEEMSDKEKSEQLKNLKKHLWL